MAKKTLEVLNANGLRKLRVRAGLMQEFVADKIGIKRQRLQRWEQGVNEPSVEIMVKLADIYHVDMNELVAAILEGKKQIPDKDISE